MTATYTLNAEKNGIEITFDSKPAAAILDTIKAAGYRWSRARRIWWAKQSPEALETAQSVAEGRIEAQVTQDTSQAEEAADKAQQAALKAEYLDILARDVWRNSPRLIEYNRKNIARIVRLECGGLVEIEKPRIETRFCFGYSLSSSDSTDYDEANATASRAQKDQDYFIRKNMEPIRRMIKELERPGIYSRNRYNGTDPGHPVRALEWENYRSNKPEGAQPITEADRAALIDAWERVGRDFRRCLDTYLKRYGMSKVKTWSYWRDE